MWFGPRIGRSSIDQLEEFPWSYVIFNNGKLILAHDVITFMSLSHLKFIVYKNTD